MKCPLLSLIILLVLKSNLSSFFFWLVLAWYNFFHPFTFNLFYLSCISYVCSIFFNHSDNLDLLVVALEITTHFIDLLQFTENIYFYHFPNNARNLEHLNSSYTPLLFILLSWSFHFTYALILIRCFIHWFLLRYIYSFCSISMLFCNLFSL